MTETLSGSITLTRVKKGVNVVLTITTENGAMYQGYNPTTGEVKPSFKTESNQPVLVPNVVATNKKTASINQGFWYYNNATSPLTTTDKEYKEGFMLCTDARFAINPTNYKLRIVDDIASEGNTSNDLFTFECDGEVQGTEYQTKGSITLHLQTIGTSAITLLLTTTKASISADNEATLTANLYVDCEPTTSTDYHFRFYTEAGMENGTVQNGESRTYSVKRADVTNYGKMYCSVYRKTDASTILGTAAVVIIDIEDKHEISVDASPADWDGSTKQTLKAHLIDVASNEEIVNPTGTFQHSFKSSATMVSCGTKDGQSVEIGSEEWSKVPSNEDLTDFVSYNF